MFYNNADTYYTIRDVFRVTRKKGCLFYSGRDFSGLAFRLSGQSVFNNEISAGTGSITYIPQGLDFEICSEPEDVIILHLDCPNENTANIVTVSPGNYDKFADLFLSMYTEWQQRKPGFRNRCTALLYTVFEKLEKADAIPENAKTKLIQKGILYMQTNYADASLTIADIAERCNISEVYFRKIYKELYGTSPAKALLSIRIQHAIRLLESGYYRILDVAHLCGFGDIKYFSTVFKKETGNAPSYYLYK
ncbi:MAG: helix-turn-helix transcriptional regulator [Clostridia bacterium]|nr:helix-turn-helix transcriptional regulator [Clostridia bacterium]